MNERFISLLIKRMISSKGFMPIRNSDGTFYFSNTINTIVKDSNGWIIILDIIDVDQLTDEQIKARLESNNEKLKSIKGIYFEVLVSRYDMHKIDIESNNIKCYYVNLTRNESVKDFKTPFFDYSIQKNIKKSFTMIDDELLNKDVYEIVNESQKALSLEIEPSKPIITYILIAINILVFGLLKYMSYKNSVSYNELLMIYGAKENLKILSGEYFRLFTAIFLHADISHLLFNCYSLYVLGSLMERIYGNKKFVFIYFVAGFFGSITSFNFSQSNSVGASGAIFGLLGAALFFGIIKPKLFNASFGYNVILMIFINLVFGFSNPNIDNSAHIGGLIGGFLATGIINSSKNIIWYKKKELYIALSIIVATSILFMGFNNNENKILMKVDQLEEYETQQNWEAAEQFSEEILSLDPKNINSKIKVLWILTKSETIQNKYDEAIYHGELLKEIDSINGHYILGIIYINMEDYQLAYQELIAAKKAGSTHENLDKLIEDVNSFLN